MLVSPSDFSQFLLYDGEGHGPAAVGGGSAHTDATLTSTSEVDGNPGHAHVASSGSTCEEQLHARAGYTDPQYRSVDDAKL